MTKQFARAGRTVALVAVCAGGVFAIVASNPGGGTPPTTGGIEVTDGRGAFSSAAYACTDSITFTIIPQTLTGTGGTTQAQSKKVYQTGYSNTTDREQAACSVTTIFSGLKTGSWLVSNSFVNCAVNVTAGGTLQPTKVRIKNNVCP